MEALKKVESGHYENATHRVFKVEKTVYKTIVYRHHDRASSCKEVYWTVVNKVTGERAAGFGTKKHATKAIEDGMI